MELTGDVAVVAGSGPAIIIVITVLRQVGVAQKYTPLIAVLIGVVFAVLAILFAAAPVVATLIAGVIAGGSAVGLHQAGRNVNREVLGHDPGS